MISIIIPLYNKEKIIERTLRSVLSQDYDDFEVVIVDDGSTDDSCRVAEETLKLLKPSQPVKLLHQENGGPSKARNTGVKHAKGEWIVFLDADDELLPGALKHYSDLVKQHKEIDFFITGYKYKSKEGKIKNIDVVNGSIKNPFKQHFFSKITPHVGSTLISKNLCSSCLFNERYRRYEDFDAWFRMYKLAKIYADSFYSFILNGKYSSASIHRFKICEDFVGHLSFKGKSFWEKMCIYQLFLWERNNYSDECLKIYESWYKRWDLLLLYKVLQTF